MDETLDVASLPMQTPKSLQEKIAQVRQQQELLGQMRASGDPALLKQADALQEQYHVRDMAELAGDVYASAAHRPASPGLGWIRASEHPELLRERLDVDWTDQQIEDYLQPLHSDFRAEIYIPDPRVYGPDTPPVIVDKGSNGLVAVPDSHGGTQYRESALEDWIENARQGIGLESDHANRAMKLAVEFRRSFHGTFELAGHSKGAADAAACSKLTGMPGYIFNGAGTHPNTVQRYADQHHLPILGSDNLVSSYYVKGEILHDTQQGIHDMDGLTRLQVGLAAQQFAELGSLTDVHMLAKEQLAKALPYDPKMQHDALQLIDYLGTHSGPQLLKQMPLATGERQTELPARMRDGTGDLVDRPQHPSLSTLGADSGPLMNVVSGALIGGVVGKRGGEVVAAGGEIMDHGIRWSGAEAKRDIRIVGYVLNDQVEGHGRLVAGAMHYGGAAAADMRVVYGQAESLADRSLGKLAQWSNAVSGAIDRAESHLPFMGGLRQAADASDRATAIYVERQRAEAAEHQRDAHDDARAIRQLANTGAAHVMRFSITAGNTLQRGAEALGETINDRAHAAGSSVRAVTDRMPEATALIGMVAGTVVVATGELAAAPLETLSQAEYVRRHGASAVAEAIDRHGVQDVILPSLDARTRDMEGGAVGLMREQRARSAAEGQRAVDPEKDPNAFVQRMLDSAEAGNWGAFRIDTQTLAAMAPGSELRAQAAAQVDQQHQAALQQEMEQQQVTQVATARGMVR